MTEAGVTLGTWYGPSAGVPDLVPLDWVVTSPALVRLGAKPETLDEAFARLSSIADSFAGLAGSCGRDAVAARRSLESPYFDGLTGVGIYALWVTAKLAEIEAEWSEAIDVLLASDLDGDPFRVVSNRIDRRRNRLRTAVTRAAYGIPYSMFVR